MRAVSLERPEGFGVEVLTERTTVVTALPLERAARDRLAELLDARVVDVRDPIDRVDLVLTPACSPQLIAALKPILRSGADAYVLADSIEELARKITPRGDRTSGDSAPDEARELLSTATVDELIAAFLRESVEYSTRLRAGDDHRR